MRLYRLERSPKKADLKKQKVRQLTRKAIRKSQLVPQPCAICGSLDVEAHHPDYDAPDAHLKVVWLCKKHHALEGGKRDWTRQIELFPAL